MDKEFNVVNNRNKYNKYTIEEIREILRKLGYELLTKNYINNKSILIFKDSDGYYYVSSLKQLMTYKPSKFHISNPYTIQNIKLLCKIIGDDYELVSETYIHSKKDLVFKDKYNYFYSMSLNIFQSNIGHTLRIVDKANLYAIQNIKLWCKLNNKLFELVSEIYVGKDAILQWRCLKEDCGEIFKMRWGDVFHNECGCSICSGHQVGLSNCLETLNPVLASEWHPIKNGDLTPFDVTCGSGKLVWWQCSKCGHEWDAIINNRSSNASGCPKCNNSKAEEKALETLNKYNIPNLLQHKFKNCKDIKSLPFDIATFINSDKIKLRILIEVDGEHHYKPVRFGGISFERAEKKFIECQHHDKIKNNYCINNNIPLLRIPYWDFYKIEEILVDVLVNGNMDSLYFIR